MEVLLLFYVFMKVGVLAVGGAYSFLPLIKWEAVNKYAWMSEQEFAEILAAVQLTPGAISIKYASFIGYRVAGIPGAVAANLGNFLPAVVFFGALLILMKKFRDTAAMEGAIYYVRIAVSVLLMVMALRFTPPTTFASLKPAAAASVFILMALSGKVPPAAIILSAALAGLVLR